MLRDHTAGDPMRQEVRWTDLTYEQIAEHLAEAGTKVSVPVVKQLLRKHGYVTRKARKSRTMGRGSMPSRCDGSPSNVFCFPSKKPRLSRRQPHKP